jgi:hypothetical protein
MTFREAKHNHGMHNYEINNVDVQATMYFYKKQGKEGVKYQEQENRR